jgi:ABC-2 type transport system ATP-binding protein
MIETERLTKRYGDLVAVDELSFSVGQGEVLGFLGPNGAGKSTTMKMIAGFLTPTEGAVRVCGHDVEANPVAAKREIGYLPEGAPCYGEMTPASFLDFVADVRGLSGAAKDRHLAEAVERLHLDEVLTQPIDTLSKGYKRRVGLAQAILHDPRVLILDEPTDGLDPNQKHEVRSLIREISSDKTIVISTHILEEVHAVCSRAIIIAHGRILADDTPSALEARARHHNAVSLKLSDVEPADVRAALTGLEAVDTVEQGDDGQLRIVPRDGKFILAAVGRLALEKGWHVDELQVESGQLDEVFRDITTTGPAREVRT